MVPPNLDDCGELELNNGNGPRTELMVTIYSVPIKNASIQLPMLSYTSFVHDHIQTYVSCSIL